MYKSGDFLKTIYKTECLIRRKREQLERMEHLAVYSGIRYGDEPRGTGGAHDTKAEIVAGIIDLKDEIGRQLDALIDIKLRAMKMIDSLDSGDMIDVLYMRYFEFRKWEDIAKEKNRSMDWVFRTHRHALRKLEGMM